MPERHRFIRGMVAWIGGKQVPLALRPQGARRRREQVSAGQDGALRRRRHHRLLGGAADGLDDHRLGHGGWSASPSSSIRSSAGCWAYNLPGWTSLMAAVGLLGGMQFLMLGIIGAYLGRLYDQSKGRPLFMIRDIVGGPK